VPPQKGPSARPRGQGQVPGEATLSEEKGLAGFSTHTGAEETELAGQLNQSAPQVEAQVRAMGGDDHARGQN